MTQASFKFISEAAGGDRFAVISFTGKEAISTLYQYEIEIRAPLSVSISLDDVLDSPAKFISELDDKEFPVYGILSDFQEQQIAQGYVFYKAVLVPRLWGLSIYKTNEIYTQEQTVDKIIETVIDSANGNGAGIDYDLNGLGKNHLLSRDYVCQFGESDFDFISRLIENEGIFYYFDQTGGDAEKIIFINDMNYESITRPGLIFDMTPSISRQYDCIDAWSCRKQRLAARVTVRDFNPDHPGLDIADTTPIDQMGRGTEYIYGANIQDTDEASYLSEIRAEESLCKRTRYYAESSVFRLQAGYLFEMEMHPNDTYNGVEYLVVEVNHEGFHLDTSLPSGAARSPEALPQYRNSFVAINATEQYRPARITHRPRFYGTMTAFIYAETGINKAEIDEQGRYRVLLPFDRADGTKESTDPNRKASTWIRMAQNYVGEDKGSYYPLTGGTEVLLSFINGDPDQPIIIGAVPNASEPSLLKSDNEFESTVQTGSGNKIRMGDVEGEDRIVMESPTASSWMRIGTPNDPFDVVTESGDASDGIKMATLGSYALNVGGNAAETVTGNATQTVSGDLTQTVTGVVTQDITGNTTSTVDGNYKFYVTPLAIPPVPPDPAPPAGSVRFEIADDKVVLNTGGRDLDINCNHYNLENSAEDNITSGHDYARHDGTSHEDYYGNKFEWMLGGAEEFYVGGKTEVCVAESVEVFVGAKQEFSLNLVDISVGFGFKLDLNFSLGFEYAPLMFEAKGVQAKKEDLVASKEAAVITDRLLKLESAKIKLYKGIFNLNKATAKLDNAHLYMSL